MKKLLLVVLALLLAAPVFAQDQYKVRAKTLTIFSGDLKNIGLFASSNAGDVQDDCPAGHLRNPPVSALDDASMLAAYQASFRGLFGRESTLQPGAGADDGWYFIHASNHYGVYGDDQCHAGWSGYWESWLKAGRGDLALVQTPAHFQPAITPPPIPVPIPVPTPTPSIDWSGVYARLDQLVAQVDNLTKADGDAHASINQNVSDGRAENRNFFQSIGDHWKSIVAIAGPFMTYAMCRVTNKCQ